MRRYSKKRKYVKNTQRGGETIEEIQERYKRTYDKYYNILGKKANKSDMGFVLRTLTNQKIKQILENTTATSIDNLITKLKDQAKLSNSSLTNDEQYEQILRPAFKKFFEDLSKDMNTNVILKFFNLSADGVLKSAGRKEVILGFSEPNQLIPDFIEDLEVFKRNKSEEQTSALPPRYELPPPLDAPDPESLGFSTHQGGFKKRFKKRRTKRHIQNNKRRHTKKRK